MPPSSRQRATWAGPSSRLTPSVSTTSAEPHKDDTERLPCLATLTPAPAATNAVAVETLKVPEASPPVPHVSINISRSVPVAPTTSPSCARTFTTFCRITWAKPISSSTISPFIRSAVRNAAIWALVAAPDMMASIAAAASMRVRARRSTRAGAAGVDEGAARFVHDGAGHGALGRPILLPAAQRGQEGERLLQAERLGQHRLDAVAGQLLRRHLHPEARDHEDGQAGPELAH